MEISNLQIVVGTAFAVVLYFVGYLWWTQRQTFQPTDHYPAPHPYTPPPREKAKPPVTIEELDKAIPHATDEYKADCLREQRTIYSSMQGWIEILESEQAQPSDFLAKQREKVTR